MARPKLHLCEKDVLDLAKIGCTYEEIATLVSCDKQTLLNRFSDTIKAGHENMKMSLRRAQLRKALTGGPEGDGHPTMLIWLGKQLLGQRDNWDIGNVGGKPFKVEQTGLQIENLPKDVLIQIRDLLKPYVLEEEKSADA